MESGNEGAFNASRELLLKNLAESSPGLLKNMEESSPGLLKNLERSSPSPSKIEDGKTTGFSI